MSVFHNFDNLFDTFYEYYNLLNRLIKMLNKHTYDYFFVKNQLTLFPRITKEGNKKTIFLNFKEICLKLNRHPNHVLNYLLKELGTLGSFQKEGYLLLRGSFNSKGIQLILHSYVQEYVLCGSCGSSSTQLKKNKNNRLLCFKCEFCKACRFIKYKQIEFTVQKKK
ncbi:translation initiation factor eiF2 beta-subunit (nucleomorph) [Cryptomonas paramecium]|uniref:Translation initiation factor eiF2 beta-subunit n=1 Tax=Cryptomonas paramaecium TaxID=2898 RepID=F2HHT7_9CRYP|nr:translation initiation factor eiF2 beta-subunit [Cryptomonas paramecium]AEA38883.1 translation initiation factor eiF2 beta-subunit [Cryptomonas paramecium]|mmetsp:Transcript_88802/g.236405  ORF Transcript_88802/g.236405 Transcript_88802/m.236405 type:complete len:166 (-) Transcript_88802:406-903(-)